MGSLLGAVILPAAGSALSPTLVVATSLVLSGGTRAVGRAVAVWVGALVALGVWALLFVTAARAVVAAVDRTARDVGALGDVMFGVVLLAVAATVGVHTWWARRAGHPRQAPRTPPGVPAARPLWRFGVLGFVLQGRDVSSVLLFGAAVQHLATMPATTAERVAVLAVVLVITTSPIWATILLDIRVPASLMARLRTAEAWLDTHRQEVIAGVCAVFGALLVVRGLSAVTG